MLLAPFKWIVELLFNWSFALFHDPGWAVVGMSVLLSLLLTPLYVWIERRKIADKAKNAPMQAEIDKIDAVYSGRERFYYTREIRRRYRYSPWTAMIPTLGLLVQIPFLLAAYHYLSGLALFDGAAFWYVKDLSKPDTIATFAGLPINLLAIVMTAINIVSVWRYAESGRPKERIQYMAVAAVFLFLLYNCAASVVLYWTLSNALSLVRSEVLFNRREHAVSGDVHRLAFLGWAKGMVASYGVQMCVVTALYFIVAAGLYPEKGVFKSFPVYRLLVLDALCFAIVGEAIAMSVSRRAIFRCSFAGFAVCGCIVLQGACLALAALRKYTCRLLEDSPILVYFSERSIPLLLVVAMVVVLVLVAFASPYGRECRAPLKTNSEGGKGWGGIAMAAVVYLTLTILLWHPILVYSSDPGTFAVSGWRLLWAGVANSVAWIVLSFAVWRMCLARIAPSFFATILLFSASVAFVYLFILPIPCGTLQGTELIGADNLVCSHAELVLEFVFLVAVAGGVCWCVRVANRRLIFRVLLLLNVVCAGQALFKLVSAGRSALGAATTGKSGEKIVFSKNHRNVLIIVLDMVQGWSFHTISDSKAFAKSLDGFTYYPNTLSVSTMTCPSIPVLYAGKAYTPDKLGKIEGATIGDKGRTCLGDMNRIVSEHGYDVYVFNPKLVYASEYNKRSALYDSVFLSGMLDRKDPFSKLSVHSVLCQNALLQAAPLFLKSSIYNDGAWLGGGIGNFVPYGDDHQFLEALPLISGCDETERGSYLFVHTEVTHNPWGIPLNDGGFREVDDKEILRWTMQRVVALFEWMKANGVYDNTRIILVSDHGLVNLTKDRWVEKEDPFRHRKLWAKLAANCGTLGNEWSIQSLNALLCIKDFDDRFPIRTDNRLAGNEDTVELALSGRMTDVTDSMPDTRRAFLIAPPAGGRPFQPLSSFPISAVFDVKNNIFDLRNWARVED